MHVRSRYETYTFSNPVTGLDEITGRNYRQSNEHSPGLGTFETRFREFKVSILFKACCCKFNRLLGFPCGYRKLPQFEHRPSVLNGLFFVYSMNVLTNCNQVQI